MNKPASQTAESESTRAARETTRRYLEALEAELSRVQAELSALSTAHSARESAEYVCVEERSTVLANLYVSCARLDRAEGRAEVLVALEEIVINVLGSEELAVFEVRERGAGEEEAAGRGLEVLTAFGLDAPRLAAIAAGGGAVERAAAGAAWMTGDSAPLGRSESGMTACVPIVADGPDERVRGVLAIFQLLPHKSELGAGDRELLHVLSRHAAHALRRTQAMQ